MARVRAGLIAAFTFTAVLVVPPPTVAPPVSVAAKAESAAVVVRPDYPNRTIYISAKLAIAFNDRQQPETAQAIKQEIIDKITAAWNGHMFACFKVVVAVDIELVGLTQDADADQVPILIKTERVAARSFVRAVSADEYLSDEPEEGFVLQTGSHTFLESSVWASPPLSPGTYAHEFGHILGLDDNYVEKTRALREGAAPDVMFDNSAVSPETIAKVIRRSGKVDESMIHCAVTIDMPDTTLGITALVPGGAEVTLGFHAWICDLPPPTTDPKQAIRDLVVEGTLRRAGGVNMGPFGSASGGATSQFSVLMPLPPSVLSGKPPVKLGIPVPATKPTSIQVPLQYTALPKLIRPGTTIELVGGGTLIIPAAITITDGAAECA